MTQEAVLITGGTSGIGRATAELLHERGVRVMVTASSNESVAAARAQLPEEIVVVRADTASLDDTARGDCKVVVGYMTLGSATTSSFIPSATQAAVRNPDASQEKVITSSLTPSWIELASLWLGR